ncbi:MAG: exosortase/archaeosortase family protein [Verrucomicrobiaceae bacterium]|nr:MAG: exosortase/archaeosortase family protein [Verrucomicrobiaceae bacterium]
MSTASSTPDAGKANLPWLNHWSLLPMAFGFLPLVGAFFLNLWSQPEYQFFPEALAAAAFFAWTRIREVPRPFASGFPGVTIAVLGISFAILTLGLVIWSPWLGMIAALLAGVAVVWWCGGRPMLQSMIPAFVMLAVIIPPPLGLDVRLGLFLRSVATILSSSTLHLLGVTHSVEGHVIALPGQKLLVEEACSGINSLMFITAFSLFFLLWKRRKLWCYAVVVPAALAMVVIGNVVRITLGAWLRYHGGLDILTGWKHEWLSIILVVAYIALVIALERVLPRGNTKSPDAPEIQIPGTPEKRPSLRWARAAGIVFAILGVIGIFRGWEKLQEGVEPLRMARSSLKSTATFRMPESIGGWTRLETGPPLLNKIESLGLSTLIWTYETRGMRAVVALDYPISGYHDVEGCYKNAGWVIGRKEHNVPRTGKPDRIEIEMKKSPDSQGTLWFATMNEQGRRVDEADPDRNFWGRFVNLGAPRETTYRIQLLIVGNQPLDGAGRAAAEELFEKSTDILFPQVLQQLEK